MVYYRDKTREVAKAYWEEAVLKTSGLYEDMAFVRIKPLEKIEI